MTQVYLDQEFERAAQARGISEEALARLEELERLANPGPWIVQYGAYDGKNWFLAYGTDDETGEEVTITTDLVHASEMRGTAGDDARFVAEARTLMPGLIAEVRRLWAAADAMEQVLGGQR